MNWRFALTCPSTMLRRSDRAIEVLKEKVDRKAFRAIGMLKDLSVGVLMNRKSLQLLCLVPALLGLVSACGGSGGGHDGNMPGTLQLLRTSFDAAEGTIVNIRVARSGGSDGVASVDYATVDGTAMGGSDYTPANGTLTWPDGLSGNLTISIAITDDSSMEPTESFTVTLSNVSVATLAGESSATVNIAAD